MEENHPLRFGFWPSVILLTDHYVLVSVLNENSCHSVLASPWTAGCIFLIPSRLKCTLLFFFRYNSIGTSQAFQLSFLQVHTSNMKFAWTIAAQVAFHGLIKIICFDIYTYITYIYVLVLCNQEIENKLLEILEKGNIKSEETSLWFFVMCVLDKTVSPQLLMGAVARKAKFPLTSVSFRLLSRHYNSVHRKKACNSS